MVAYSFQSRFVPQISVGLGIPHYPGGVFGRHIKPKRQTIRGPRKRHARPEEQVQLYTNMRTKECKLIGRARCVSAGPIHINFGKEDGNDGWIKDAPSPLDVRVWSGRDDLHIFAQMDGFINWDDMREFFLRRDPGRLTFDGILIRWEPLMWATPDVSDIPEADEDWFKRARPKTPAAR